MRPNRRPAWRRSCKNCSAWADCRPQWQIERPLGRSRRRSYSQTCRGTSGARAGRDRRQWQRGGGAAAPGHSHCANRVRPTVPDPVGAGFVESLARPGGNATGFVNFEYGIGAKWLELLKEIAPGTTRVAVLRRFAWPSDPVNSVPSKRWLRRSGWKVRPIRRARTAGEMSARSRPSRALRMAA